MHQGIGLDAFNELPLRKAVHALFECCSCVTMAGALADARPYPDRDSLYRRADAVLFSLSEGSVDEILQAYPSVGSRPGSARSHAEQCSVWDPRPELMDLLHGAVQQYRDRFGFEFVMHVAVRHADALPVTAVIAAIDDRMHHDDDTERKVLRNELAKINRSRLERMLGPDGGYDNWI